MKWKSSLRPTNVKRPEAAKTKDERISSTKKHWEPLWVLQKIFERHENNYGHQKLSGRYLLRGLRDFNTARVIKMRFLIFFASVWANPFNFTEHLKTLITPFSGGSNCCNWSSTCLISSQYYQLVLSFCSNMSKYTHTTIRNYILTGSGKLSNSAPTKGLVNSGNVQPDGSLFRTKGFENHTCLFVDQKICEC